MSKLSSPQPAEIPLLATPLAFVCAGAVAALAAHLFVSTDDLTLLYMDMGVELPYVVYLLVENPVLLPLAMLAGAVGILCGPRITLVSSDSTRGARAAVASATTFLFTRIPVGRPGTAEGARCVASGAALLFTAFAALLAYSHNLVFMEMQRALQQ